jgi:predicted GNAT family acetyltransferase
MIMDEVVQRSVVAILRRRPTVLEVGPFVLGCDPSTDSRFINYATPRPGAAISAADVADLVSAFTGIDRLPRLEYVASSSPDLERQLLAAGFTVEARHEYLVCSPQTLSVPPTPEGIQLDLPADDDEVRMLVNVQHQAFGAEQSASDADVARVRRTQALGGVVLLARDEHGVIVGGGQSSPPSAGLTEVAGIAVGAPFRRRGIAGALTAAITGRAFASGVEAAWLEASGEDSWRVYERVGFQPHGKRLYIALEPSA